MMRTIKKTLFIAVLFTACLNIFCGGGSNGDSVAGDTTPDDTETEDFPMSWQFDSGVKVGEPDVTGAIAPEIQVMDDGTYRMYYTVTGMGVGSASSDDGITWTVEEGLRITSLRNTPDYEDGEIGFDIGHPWLIHLNDGRWRMFLQASTSLGSPLQIISAISDDGFEFELEDGIRLNLGSDTGLAFAGHGRAWFQDDGTLGMLFSGNLMNSGNQPSDIMLATSSDEGVTWKVINNCLFIKGHDPTVIRMNDGRLAAVYSYLLEALYVSFSDDGISWNSPKKLTLYDENGYVVSTNAEDVAIFRMKDGALSMMRNGSSGIYSLSPKTQ